MFEYNQCTVCGARTPLGTWTCSPECTNAKKNGITREEQIYRDMNRQPWGKQPAQPLMSYPSTGFTDLTR